VTPQERAELAAMDAAWLRYTGPMPDAAYRRWCELQIMRRDDALAAGAQSAETNEDLAQSEGRQSGGSASERNAQSSPPPSHTPR
jgi:hypothetical protein